MIGLLKEQDQHGLGHQTLAGAVYYNEEEVALLAQTSSYETFEIKVSDLNLLQAAIHYKSFATLKALVAEFSLRPLLSEGAQKF